MKQIDNKKLCFYCLGCNKLENEYFSGVIQCKNFVAGQVGYKKEERRENGR